MQCIGRVLLVNGRSLIFGENVFMELVAMSVGVEVFFAGTSSFVTAIFVFNLYVRKGCWLGFVRVCGSCRVRVGLTVGMRGLFIRNFLQNDLVLFWLQVVWVWK